MNPPAKNQRLVARAGQGYEIRKPSANPNRPWPPENSLGVFSKDEVVDMINSHVGDLRFCDLEYVAARDVRESLPCEYIRAVA
jgi:hypothetical protein